MGVAMRGLDVVAGSIVEIGALIGGSRNVFSTVVNPGRPAAEDGAVHGIPHSEMLQGPSFREAFDRLRSFLAFAALSLPQSDSDSSDCGAPATSFRPDVDTLVVAHNGAAAHVLARCH